MVRMISWNVNGIRAVLKKNFMEFMNAAAPDILCLQETRGYPDNIDELLPTYHKFWNHAEKKGYSGTAIFVKKSRKKALQIQQEFFDMGLPEYDQEGRITYVEFPDYYVLTVYTPNAGEGLKRHVFRQAWDQEFIKFVSLLNKKKPVILCGDLNVAHTEIDLANPRSNRKNAGFTDEERAGFTRLLEAGFLDTFRMFNKDGGHYSWWSYRFNARKNNKGWRIDYFCVPADFSRKIKSAGILNAIYGSDHCPVELVLK